MPTTSYKLGRNAVAELPGVDNDDIKDVTINVSAEQIDVTTFKATALTSWEYMAGLTDITVEVTCTQHSAAVSDVGPADIAGLPSDLEASVLSIQERVTPRGVVEYTISYGFAPPAT